MFASQISFLAWLGGRINTSEEIKKGIKRISKNLINGKAYILLILYYRL